MADRVLEISTPGYFLSRDRGFLIVSRKNERSGSVPIDDLLSVMISTPGCTISTNLLDSLAAENIPLVLIGKNYLPSSINLPISGNASQFSVMRSQAALSEPRRKRAWQKIIKAKIRNQSEVLDRAGMISTKLQYLSSRVRSGDPDNIEAQAARYYWPTLFGSDFRRDRSLQGLNASLNYAYTVLRACVARAICSVGLHPSFSLHHKNARNTMNLADDLMEPLRPIADYLVHKKIDVFTRELTQESKQLLTSLLNILIDTPDGSSPLSLASTKMCRSLVAYYASEADNFYIPNMPSSNSYDVC